MGAVYKTEHLISKRTEAMKLLLTGSSSGPDEERRFAREIEVQARLHHPHIAYLYNAVRLPTSIALVMEYVEGEALSRILERGPLPVRTAVDLASQVLDALAYAHEQGVIHRDVAPGNILITKEGTVKLTDFGLACAVNDLHRSSRGAAAGSLWYMSPEQVTGSDEVDSRTDIYATGAVLHEMLTGRKLFDVDGAFAIMSAQMATVPLAPSEFNREVSKGLDAIVAKAVAKDPAARFPSAGEFRSALEAAVRGIPPSAGVSHRDRGSIRAGKWLTAAAALVLVIGNLLLWSSRRRIERMPVPAPHAAAGMPQAMVPAQETTVAPGAAQSTGPEHLPAEVDNALGEPRRPVADTRPARKPKKRDPTFGIVITGGETPPPAIPSRSPHTVSSTLPASTLAIQPDTKIVPDMPPPAIEEPTATPERPAAVKEIYVAQPVEPNPSKTGNRFVRALSKINPFARGSKQNGADPGKSPLNKSNDPAKRSASDPGKYN